MSTGPGIEFSAKEFADEVQVMADLAGSLLDRKAKSALERFKTDIMKLDKRPTDRSSDLVLQDLRTKVSRGEYEGTGRKGKDILAEINSKWKIMPVGTSGKKRPRQRFKLTGLASTRISIMSDQDEILARWHVDIANRQGPGCLFHVQMGQTQAEKPFPVPRFPSLVVTPMDALDFVLGEIFPDSWLKVTSAGLNEARRWRKLQQYRLVCLLDWYRKSAAESSCSPWLSIKNKHKQLDENEQIF